MSVSPHFHDPLGNKRFVVTMQVDSGDLINGIAFGLKGPAGIDPDQMRFGACVPDGTADGIDVNTCTANSDLGPGVADSAVANTYTVDPNSNELFPDDTLMVALRGNFDIDFDGPSLNNGNALVALGVVEYLIEGDLVGGPTIDFLGATSMPGVTAAIELVGGGTISSSQVSRVSGGNSDLDRDDDKRGDNADNCPDKKNLNQENNGGLRFVGPGDNIGDVCQCGDSGGDGAVDNALVNVGGEESPVTNQDDVTNCQLALAGVTTGDLEADADRLARCSVTGGQAPTIIDLVVLELDLAVPGSAGAVIEQVCEPASN
jgi:hypothetical protein